VVFNRTDSATEWNADYHRHLVESLGAVLHLGQLGGDLVESREDKAVELDLDYWAIPAHGQTDSGSHNARFSNWRIHDSLWTELIQDSLGYAEHTAKLSDVLSASQNFWIPGHCLTKTSIDCLCDWHFYKVAHAAPPSLLT
jgi:hypothetical protein